MKRIVVHVGLPKCGSSSIQATFSRARERLRAEGVLYPEMRQRYERGEDPNAANGHMALRAEIRNARFFDGRMPILDAVLADFDASDVHTLLLSSEGFFYLFAADRPEVAVPVRRRLAGRNVEVVAFFRRRDRFALSQYKQSVKDVRRFGGTFADALANPEVRMVRRARIDPAAQLTTVGDAFAARTCTPICLDAPGSDAVALLGARVGIRIASDPVGGGVRTNVSPSDVETAYLAWCNASGMPDDAFYTRWVALEGIDLSDVAPGFRIAGDAALRDLAEGTEADYAALDRAFGFAHPPVMPSTGDRVPDVLTPDIVEEIERRVTRAVAEAPQRIEARARSLVLRRGTILGEGKPHRAATAG